MENKTGFRAVFVRECWRIAKSKIYIWGVICAALISLVILMFLMNEGLPHKMPIAVVDLDNTATTRTLIRQLDAFPKTDIKYKSLSFKEARKKMERLEIYAFLIIPKDFTADAQSGNQPQLVYYTNNAFMISGSLLFQDLKTISTLASASVGLKTATAKGMTTDQIMPIVSPITVEAHPLNNPYLNYSIILNSILQPCILQLLILMFTISSFGSEIKSRTGEALVRLSGNSSWKMVLGKLLPNTIVFFLIACLYISILYYYNSFPMNNGLLIVFATYLVFILAAQALGITLLWVFKNYRLAISTASLLGMLSFSIAGFSFPSTSQDPILEASSYIFPVKYFYTIYGDQVLNGFPLAYSWKYFAGLLGFILIGVLLIDPVRKVVEYDEYEP